LNFYFLQSIVWYLHHCYKRSNQQTSMKIHFSNTMFIMPIMYARYNSILQIVNKPCMLVLIKIFSKFVQVIVGFPLVKILFHLLWSDSMSICFLLTNFLKLHNPPLLQLICSFKKWAKWLRFENHPNKNVVFVWLSKIHWQDVDMFIDHLCLLPKNKGGLIKEYLYIV